MVENWMSGLKSWIRLKHLSYIQGVQRRAN